MTNHPQRSRTDGSKITKHKDPAGWRIYVGGKPTDLLISKGMEPRYREPQMYQLWTEADDFLFEAAGVSLIMARLEVIRAALTTPEKA